jgi:hypothetical protein
MRDRDQLDTGEPGADAIEEQVVRLEKRYASHVATAYDRGAVREYGYGDAPQRPLHLLVEDAEHRAGLRATASLRRATRAWRAREELLSDN